MQKKLFIISNESIFFSKNSFFCDNLDMKSTPEGLKEKFEINIIARNSNKNRSHEIKIKKIHLHKNIFSFLFTILKSFGNENSRYLIISISLYTFFACIILAIFRKKPMLYLRSNGYEEYRSILGFLGPIIYHLMFSITSKISRLISCSERILRGKKGDIVSPSQLTSNWFLNATKAELVKIRLLYVGRLRVEKGIFSLLDILKKINEEISLSIVGIEKFDNKKITQENVNIHEIETKEEKLIKFYDDHNIFVLPSYTEGFPMVLSESLARLRPVIIFKEIEHVIGDKKGIFVANRNPESFLQQINYIKNNYQKIQEDMKKNDLPSKKNFLREFERSILNSD